MRSSVVFVLVAVVVTMCAASDSDAQVARTKQEMSRLLEKLGLPDRPRPIDASRMPQSLIQRLAGAFVFPDQDEDDDDGESVSDWMIPAQSSPQGQICHLFLINC